jgi:hypothetical protein
MNLVTIDNYDGEVPVNVLVADSLGNNRQYLGQITVLTPSIDFEVTGTTLNDLSSAMIIIQTTGGCETFQVASC